MLIEASPRCCKDMTYKGLAKFADSCRANTARLMQRWVASRLALAYSSGKKHPSAQAHPGEKNRMSPVEGSTVIGKSVIVRGELSGNEDLIMDGDLEGSITLSESKLTIGPNARVIANVTVRDLIVFGKLTGNVIASGRIELRQTAIVSGDIVASRLSIEESAVFQGRVDLTGVGTKAAATSASSVSTPATPPAANLFASEPKA